jgi:hypothetical protein
MKNFETSGGAANPKDDETMTVSLEGPWVYGWTHYGMTGQTKARMNELTREVEVRERNKWIKCRPGSDEFFSSTRCSDQFRFS